VTIFLYGVPAPGLVEIPQGALQTSPLVPGSADLATMPDASADEAVVLAPPGTIERDHVLAQALRVLKPGGRLVAFAPKDKGGSRLRKALEAFGCTVAEDARKHHRFCRVERPTAPVGLEAAIAAGAPRILPDLGVWSQPGVFSWDRLDPGSARLLDLLPPLTGRGADLGCGVGVLAGRLLASHNVDAVTCVDVDRRAVECAKRNLSDPRAMVFWADVRRLSGDIPTAGFSDFDFVVMNPPFHDGGTEDRELGVAFIRTAVRLLRRGGVCWLVANRHLPYEAALREAFTSMDVKADAGGYKIVEARK
jgi:16S rRNA (guanine1207-N2)-methyltransferase